MAIQRQHGAFINARYSTDNQNPDSIEVQVDKCSEWCRNNSIPILGIYADEATSGMKDTRPQYEAMMQQLRLGFADTVVIYDQSRMFRKMTAWFAFRDELSAMGVRVVCVTQPMIGKDLRDPTNFLTEGSMALFNQIWALQTRQKVMEKMRFMARNGQHTGGKPALGYVVEDGRLVVCEDEAVTVRRIFTEYAEGKSYRQIIEGLNADGIRTKRGNTFGANSLHDLLRNEKYIGVLTYGSMPYREDGTRNTHIKDSSNAIRVEDAIPPIVDKELFERVQQKMEQRKHQQGGRPPVNREYPLRGKVFCADCKAAMTVSISHQKYYYYRCTGKKRLHTCNAAPIAVDELEQIVAKALQDVFGTPSNVDDLLNILRDQAQQIQGGAVTRLQALICQEQDISSKLGNALDAVLSGLSSPALKDRITDLETQKAAVAREMRVLKANVDASALPEQRLREILNTIICSSDTDPSPLLSIVYRVEVGRDTITIWTILDADPDGHIDLHTTEGLTTSVLSPSGVPKKRMPNGHPLFWCTGRPGLERALRKHAGGMFLARGRVHG